MFVFLTAFGITRQYNKKLRDSGKTVLTKAELGAFALNRYIKLLFNFWFIYLLAALTSFLREGGFRGVYFVNGVKKSIVYIILDAFGMADYFGTPTLNETWWYMSLAVFLVFVIPILIVCYKNCGILLIAVFSMISYVGLRDTGFTMYLFCVCMGIFCAEEQVLERLCQKKLFANKGLNVAIKCLLYLILMGVLFYLRDITTYSYWLDAFITMAICSFSMEFHAVWRYPGKILCFLGKHSMNIFLLHTLIFEYYFTSFIYGFRHWILVVLVLLVISLLISVVCEVVKKWIRYPALLDNSNRDDV